MLQCSAPQTFFSRQDTNESTVPAFHSAVNERNTFFSSPYFPIGPAAARKQPARSPPMNGSFAMQFCPGHTRGTRGPYHPDRLNQRQPDMDRYWIACGLKRQRSHWGGQDCLFLLPWIHRNCVSVCLGELGKLDGLAISQRGSLRESPPNKFRLPLYAQPLLGSCGKSRQTPRSKELESAETHDGGGVRHPPCQANSSCICFFFALQITLYKLSRRTPTLITPDCQP